MKKFLSLSVAALLPMLVAAQDFKFNLGQRGPEIYEDYYGIFFEELSHSGEGGLYAELIQNRSFEDNTSSPDHWTAVGSATLTLTTDNMMNANQGHALGLTATAAGDGIRNDGFWGICYASGETYKASFWIRSDSEWNGTVTAKLLDSSANAIGQADIAVEAGTAWKQYTATITATATAVGGYFDLCLGSAATVELDMVSLFPPTYNNRDNGFRRDMGQMLADIKPTFMRFPGGCYIEGQWDNEKNDDFRYLWKNSVGPVESRIPLWNNRWGYMVTNGQGIYEYLLYCEDIGAVPMYVVNIGVGHEWAHDYNDLGEYIQEALDVIEYCNGDVTTTWGAKRAEAGHPEPFNLKYIEIGNENYTFDHYAERYIQFYNAIKERYPDIVCIGNAPCWGTDYPKWGLSHPVDLVDEHYYRTPEWFMSSYRHYDSYPRTDPKVYVGEWAASENKGTLGNMNAALGEAIFMCGAERNSDMVKMLSFSEPFAHINDVRWPAMIYHNSEKAVGTPSYYAQKMYGQNIGKQNIVWTETGNSASTVGVATWSTSAQFYDIQITDEAGNVILNGASTTSADWVAETGTGDWSVTDGTVTNATASGTRSTYTLRAPLGTDNFTFTLKAKKISGDEGFLIPLEFTDVNNYVWWAIGGWGNKQHGIEQSIGGSKSNPVSNIPGNVIAGQEYDIKVVRKGLHVHCYLDGSLMFEFDMKEPANQFLYASSTINDETGDLFVKLVNPGASSRTAHLSFENGTVVSGTAQVMNSTNGTDENTFDNPEAITPHDEAVTVGSDGTIDFTTKPYSINILRLKVKDVTFVSLLPDIKELLTEAAAIESDAIIPELWNKLQAAVATASAVTDSTPYAEQRAALEALKTAVDAAKTAISASPYKGQALGEGSYYLYNISTGLWLQNNEDYWSKWTTYAAGGTYGMEFHLAPYGDGYAIYTPSFSTGGKTTNMSHSDLYLDNATISTWTFESDTQAGVSNCYKIKNSNGQYIGLNTYRGNYNQHPTAYYVDNNAVNNVWQLVTREERIAYMEKNATKDNPIDATFLVTNPGFYFYNGGRGEAYTAGWTISRTGGNFETPCELWCQQSNSTWQSSSFSITQDIADIPNGEYGMTVQAFYRDGWNADINQMPRAKGTEELRAYYFIGSTEAKVMSVFDAGFMTAPTSSELGGFNGAWHGNETLGYMPDNANTFNRVFWFFPDKYVNAPIGTIVTDNQTSIGLRKPTGASADWLAFDNFRLYYYGPAVKEIALTNGYATFSASENFKVTTEGVSAYKVTEKKGNYVILTAIEDIPAGTGVVLYGEGATKAVLERVDETAADVSGNMMKPNVTATVLPQESDGCKNYLLALDPDDESVCVFRPYSGVGKLAAGRAYLALPIESNGVKYFIGFEEDDPTGITGITGHNDSKGFIYNVAGQRLEKMQKGVNILNGKKILR